MDTQTLTIKLAAEVAEFISKIKGVESLVSGVAQRMRDSFSGLWATLGATVSVAGLGAFVKASINAMDQLDELSQRYGISVKELSGLQLAFKQSGIEQDAMASSMGKLQRAMADGNRGLAAIGVGTRNADGSLRGTSAVLLDVADKFAGLQDGAGKTALAVEIFGKSGADMVPLLNSGSDGIKDMISTAERLGLVLEDEVAAKAGNFNDTLELVGMGAQGVGRGIAARLLPTLQSLAENFLTSMTNGDRLAKTAEFLANILKGLYIGALAVVEVFSTLGKTFGAVIGAFFAAAQGNFKEAWAILKEGGADVSKGWQETAAQISAAWSGAGGDTVAALAAAGGAAKKHAPDLKAIEENAKAAAKALEEQRKEQEAQAKLVAELSGVQADYELSLQRLQAQRDAGNLSEERYIELVTALIAKQPMAKKLMDEQGKTTADLAARQNQAFDDYFERSERERMAVEARIKVGRTTLEQLQFENSLLGLNATEREVAIAMRELERQGVVKGTEAWTKYATAIQSAVVDREATKKATDFWQSIETTAKGVFTDVANDGTSAFERIGKTLKASVLDVLWQITGRQWLISIGTAAGLPGAAMAGQASSGSGLLGSAGNAASVANLLGSSSALATASGAVTGFTTSMAAAAQSMVGITGTTAQMTASLTAAGHVAAPGMAAGVSAGSAFAAAAPYIAAVVAIAALAKSLDDSGTPHTGGYGSYSAVGGATMGAALRDAPGSPFGLSDDAITANGNAAAVAMAQAVVGLLDSTAQTFGKNAGYSAATAFADDTSKDGAWGALSIKLGDKMLLNWADTQTSRWAPKEFANGEAGAKEYVAAVALDVRNLLMEQTPDWADTMLQALGDAPSIDALAATVEKINAAASAFEAMGNASQAFAGMTDAATSALVQAMGGTDAAVAGLSGYYGNFYTESERAALATTALTGQLAELGQEMPASRVAFRGLVDAAIAAGDSTLAAGLINLQDEFAAVVPAAEDAAAAVSSAVTSLKAETTRLQRDLLAATGGDVRSFDTAGMSAAEVAIYDYNQSLRDQIDAANAATQANDAAAEAARARAEAVAAERDGLNRRLLEATGDTAAIRALELEALDASNRAIQEHIWAIEDAAAAYEKATTAAQSAYSTLERSVEAERGKLTDAYTVERDAITERLKIQQKGYQAQIEAAQTAADKIRDIAGALSTAVGQVRVDSPTINRAAYDAARGVIGTSDINDPRLKAALDAVSGDNKQFYGRFEDYAFEQAVTAANIKRMDATAQSQLSAADAMIQSLKASDTLAQVIAEAELAALEEKHNEQLAQLQDQLDLGKSQLDALLGIDTRVLSVADAVAALGVSISAAYAAQSAQIAAATASSAQAASGGGGGGVAYSGETYVDSQGNVVPLQEGQSRQWWEAVAQSGTSAVSSLAELEQRLAANGKTDVFDQLVSGFQLGSSTFGGNFNYTTLLDSAGGLIANQGGFAPELTLAEREAQVETFAKLWKVPGFAGGGYHAGGVRIVGEDGPELEFTGPSYIANAQQTASLLRSGGASNSEVVAELRQLNERMARIEATNAATAGHTAATDRKLARVIKNDAITTEAATA